MKLIITILALCLLALPCQATIFDADDQPFALQLISPEHFYRSESLQGLHGVREWKRQQMYDAIHSEPYVPTQIPRTCHASPRARNVFFCDYRKK